MIINKLSPQGYCGGVINAIKMAKEALDKYKKVYFLGDIIHNKYMNDELKRNGAIILEGKTRLLMLDEINDGVVLISAHGASNKVFSKAKEKGLTIIDTSCKNVLKVHNSINEYLKKDYDILYIGKENHPETEGVLGISNCIKLITSINDLTFKINDKTFITNQTTLSTYETQDIYNEIKKINDKVIINDNICNATTNRQKAVLEQPKCDLCIVVGDKKSSNANSLYKMSLLVTNTIMIESVKDLLSFDLSNIKTINITSSASTPNLLVDEIIDFLNKK